MFKSKFRKHLEEQIIDVSDDLRHAIYMERNDQATRFSEQLNLLVGLLKDTN